jgi:deoxyxylulose-5-phosphate synthase
MINLGIHYAYVEHVSHQQQLQQMGLDAQGILARLTQLI